MENLIKNKPKYFDIWDLMIKCKVVKKKHEKWKKKHCLICVKERRVGKSTQVNKLMVDNWETNNFEYACVYVRSRLNQAQTFARTFNSLNKDKYLMTDTHIYKLTISENGKELKNERKIIGFVTSLSTFETLKSQIGDIKVNLIIYDEFNDYDESNLIGAIAFYQTIGNNPWIQFLEMIASFETTQPDLLILLMGNKVNAQNDILLNLNFELPENPPEYDEIIDRSLDGFNVKIINGGYKEHLGLHAGNQLFKALSKYNAQSERYFSSGDFLMKMTKDIKCRSWMEPKNGDLIHAALSTFMIDVKNDGENLYLYENWDENEPDEIFAMNMLAYSHFSNCIITTDDDKNEFAQLILSAMKNKSCYFSSNYVRNNVVYWISQRLNQDINSL